MQAPPSCPGKLLVVIQMCLEVGGEAQSEAARRADGVAGKQPAKINHIQNVIQVLAIRLEAYGQSI